MSKDESRPDPDDALPARKKQIFRHRGGDPVTFMTTRLPGEESTRDERTRDERIRAGLSRLAREGRVSTLS
jgi:hypothetical protein